MGEGAGQMRPYDPDSQAHRDAANRANDMAGYTGNEDVGDSGNTFSPVAQPGFVGAPDPTVEPQDVDYTYNSSLDMEDTIGNATGTSGAAAGTNRPQQATLTGSDNSNNTGR